MANTYDPFNPRDVNRNEELLPGLRETEPVKELSPGVFFVTSHREATAIARDFPGFPQGGFEVVDDEQVDGGGRRVRSQDDRQLGETNPPEHTPVRKLLANATTPERLTALEPAIRAIAAELVEGFAEDGHAELAGCLAARLPALVIAAWAGITPALADRMQGYSDDVVLLRSEVDDAEIHARARERVDRFDEEIYEIIAARRAAPDAGDDLLAALIAGRELDGKPLSDRRIMTTLSKDVIMGGTETTRHLIAGAIYRVLREAGLYERLATDRARLPGVVEETMRISSPVQVVMRRAAGDHVVGGVRIPDGSTVLLSLAAANRDPLVFPEPEHFDPGRNTHAHVGFGFGLHRCVGARLATLEAVHALEALLDRFAHMRLASGYEYERVNWWMMNAPVRLDVEFEPRGPALP